MDTPYKNVHIHVSIDYLDYVLGIGNTHSIRIIRVGVHPNNSWSAFANYPFVRFLNAILCEICSV